MANLKDFATSTVLTAPSPATSGTSLVVQSGDGAKFPATPFYVTVHPPSEFPTLNNAEKLLVTTKATDTFTITRAQGDTTAKTIEVGWRISNALFYDDIHAFPLVEVTGTSQTASVNSGYIANNAALVTITLPTTAPIGSVVKVSGKGTGGWLIAQNTGETIHFGNVNTTTGTGGSLASTNRYDAVELVCITSDNDWVVASSVGNITVV